MSNVSGVHPSFPLTTLPGRAHGNNKSSDVQSNNGPDSGNPAQAARAALVLRPDLATKPFGSIVSLFARGLPLPPMETSPDTPPVTGDITMPSVTENGSTGTGSDVTSPITSDTTPLITLPI